MKLATLTMALTLTLVVSSSVRAEECKYLQSGMASVYAQSFEGEQTASGDILSMSDYTAAHPTLKYGTRVKVVDVRTHAVTYVTINDKGPFAKKRVIDLTGAPANDLGFKMGRHGPTGIKRVKLYVCS